MARRPRVALIVETSSAYGRGILRGVRRYIHSHQPWSIFLEQRDLPTRPPRWLEGWDGDGILSRATTRQLAEAAARSKIPVVELTDRHGRSGLPCVRSDDEAIARLGAEHLLERSFRHFAFCGFSREDWSRRRREGFVEVVGQSGATCQVYESPWYGADAHPWEDEQRELAAWLAGLPRPIGIMACNDVRGQHVVDACNRAGLAVPEEVAVLGVDDEKELCDLCDPPLSSVVPNPELVGYTAAEVLDRLMAGEGPEAAGRLIAPLGVVTRQSTDVLAIDDAEIAAAVRYIREHACEGATVEDVLSKVPISRSILERRFRKYLGHSPQATIRQAQLKRVKELLAETDLPLAAISDLAGFKHCEHMCVVFKREVGLTPGTFRRRTKV